MKTKFFYVFVILAINSIVCSAQFFVEGGVGVNYSAGEKNGDKQVENSFNSIWFSPQVGYWLNDNIAVGSRVVYNKTKSNEITTNLINPELSDNKEIMTSNWRFSAFSRYKLWETEKISLLLDGSIYYEESSLILKTLVTDISDSNSRFGINVFPAISYDFNDKFSIITRCNFLSMELYSEKGKFDSSYDGSAKNKTNHFNFGTSSSVFSSLGNINIGFIYNF